MENPSNGVASYWTQANALIRKNLTLQKRKKMESARLLLFPLIVCLVLFSTKKRVASEDKQFPPGHNCSDEELVNNFTQCWIRNPHEYPPLLQIPNDPAVRTAFLSFQDLPNGACRKFKSCPAIILFTGNNNSLALDLAGRFFPRSSISSSSGNMISFSNSVFGSTSKREASERKLYYDPAFNSLDPVYHIQKRCHRYALQYIWMETTRRIEVTKCMKGLCLWRINCSEINDELYKGFRDGNSEKMTNGIVAAYDFLNSNYMNFNISVWYNSSMNDRNQGKKNAVMRVARTVNLASNAYLEFLRGTNFKILFEFVKETPKHPDSPPIDDFMSGYYPNLFTWIVLELIPVILTNLVYEKQENVRIMMKMHGLGDGPYWVISYCYFLAQSSIYMLCFLATCSFLGLGSFPDHDYSLQFVFLFVYINLQIAFSFLVARMFSKVTTTSVVANLLVVATGPVGKFYLAAKVGDPSFPRHLVTVMELYPGLALYRVFLELTAKASEARLSHDSGMKWEDLDDTSNGMKEVLIIMVAEWLVFLFVSYYLDSNCSIFCFRKKHIPFSQSTLLRDSDQAEKADIEEERKRVEELLVQPDRSYSIICDNLRKVYPEMDGNPQKLAVHGLSLALARGECFGMLGPNGSGKSSIIKMMIGLTLPSAGTAIIEGLNILTDMEGVCTSMGVCLQQDLLWETLTAREHLLFYGRLKNLKGPALYRAVEESLGSVNLLNGGVADKQAGKYSRGMKRRLSVAISLIGDPKVVFMDEPSTGLDPASRYDLWKVVLRAKCNKTIILTTHSAEEAKTLCERIGILVDGRLECIGNATQLMARYGGSYVFTITTSVATVQSEQAVHKLVFGLSASAKKTFHVSRTLKFELPKNEVSIADVYVAVEAAKGRISIQYWGIVDATFEDVFVKIACGAEGSIGMHTVS